MERGDTIHRYKGICEQFLQSQGLQVHTDVQVSDTVRLRPHLFAKDGSKIIVDIVDSNNVDQLLINRYIEAMNAVPGLEVSLALIGDLQYLPDLVKTCYQNGFGIIVIQNDVAKQVLPSRPRQVQRLSDQDQFAIMPDKPFGNLLALKKCLRLCRDQLDWIELNLPKKSFETLYENILDGDLKVHSIRLIRAVDDKLTAKFHADFLKFRGELSRNRIQVELRVIIDRVVAKTIHGRYIYSKEMGRTLGFIYRP